MKNNIHILATTDHTAARSLCDSWATCLHKWRTTLSDTRSCGQPQTMYHIAESCPLSLLMIMRSTHHAKRRGTERTQRIRAFVLKFDSKPVTVGCTRWAATALTKNPLSRPCMGVLGYWARLSLLVRDVNQSDMFITSAWLSLSLIEVLWTRNSV